MQHASHITAGNAGDWQIRTGHQTQMLFQNQEFHPIFYQIFSHAYETKKNGCTVSQAMVLSKTWIENANPRVLLANQCFFMTYQTQKSVPGMPATSCDLVNSTSTSEHSDPTKLVQHSTVSRHGLCNISYAIYILMSIWNKELDLLFQYGNLNVITLSFHWTGRMRSNAGRIVALKPQNSNTNVINRIQ